MLFEEIVTLAKIFYKEMPFLKKGQLFLGGQRVKSIAQLANESTYFFPVVASENLTSDELIMIVRAIERSYAIFTRTGFSLIPAIEVGSFDDSTVKDYLSMFHTNIGTKSNLSFKASNFIESASSDFNANILNEANFPKVNFAGADKKMSVSPMDAFGKDGSNTFAVEENKPKGYSSYVNKMTPSKIISDVDWRKANELIPTIIQIPVKFISRSSNKVTEHMVELQVNVKATMHRASTDNLVHDIANTVAHKKGFLNFVRYLSGEQDSGADFIFGISQIKAELLDKKGSPWLAAFKRRKRLADIAWSMVSNNFKPIGTICLTMNEVELLKIKYNIDVFKEAEKIMKEYYLLGFLIADQTNEVLHVLYDSHPGFQEYPYKTLEREAANQDRVIKDMVKAMGAFK
ncbi:MAG: hypothetical protein KGZ74_04925 [Chitinophagaceae bacterium]|nr:hypothetical protein [Chitinophagaceae bacterium]